MASHEAQQTDDLAVGADELDFSSIGEDQPAPPSKLDLAYEVFKKINLEEQENGLSLVVSYVQGDRGKMKKFFKTHPEVPELEEQELDVLAKRYKKDLIRSIYYNFINLSKGEPVELEAMKELIGDEQQLIKLFQIACKKKIKSDLFGLLRGYLKAKREAAEAKSADAVKMFLFFDVKDENLEKLLIALDELSKKINKDIIGDLLQRHEIEIGLDRMAALSPDVFKYGQLYSHARDQISTLLDLENYQLIKNKQGINNPANEKRVKELNKIKEALKETLGIIIKKEIEDFNKSRGYYEELDEDKKLEVKKQLMAAQQATPEQLFDLKSLSFLGEIIERRVKHNQEVTDIFTDLSKTYQEEYL
jgi:hypothetical protein